MFGCSRIQVPWASSLQDALGILWKYEFEFVTWIAVAGTSDNKCSSEILRTEDGLAN